MESEVKITEYKMVLFLIDSIKKMAKLMYGDVNTYTIAKTIKYVAGVDEYTSFIGAISIEVLEDLIKSRLEKLLQSTREDYEENSNYWGE